ncbi:MAG: hypothetical protein JSS29_00810 [Proteobacteria bacterium]|nr:hypothetical protein [Pseudomonadota bacterium]
MTTAQSVRVLAAVALCVLPGLGARTACAQVAAFEPPAAQAAAPLDPARMPQINGIHLGTPLAEATAMLHRLYAAPGARVDAQNGQSLGPQHQAWPQSLRAASDSIGNEEADVDVTYPPNAAVVWHMSRIMRQPKVAHDVLVAALRAKYGHETVALHGGSDDPVATDRRIMEMYWVYDERGTLLTQAKVVQHSPFGCASIVGTGGSDANLYFNMVSNPGSPPPGYCRDAYVAVHASLSDTDIVTTVFLDMVDMPLAARAARATDSWNRGLDQKTQQSTREQAKSVQPQL